MCFFFHIHRARCRFLRWTFKQSCRLVLYPQYLHMNFASCPHSYFLWRHRLRWDLYVRVQLSQVILSVLTLLVSSSENGNKDSSKSNPEIIKKIIMWMLVIDKFLGLFIQFVCLELMISGLITYICLDKFATLLVKDKMIHCFNKFLF